VAVTPVVITLFVFLSPLMDEARQSSFYSAVDYANNKHTHPLIDEAITYEDALRTLQLDNRRVKTDALLDQDQRWACPEDTSWYLVRFKEGVALDAEFIERWLESPQDVHKFLCLRYEEPQDDKIFKNLELCREIAEKNRNRFKANVRLMRLVSSHVFAPLYQVAPTVPQPTDLAAVAEDRYRKYYKSDAVRIPKAIKYLKKKHNLLAEVDYNVKNVLSFCDDVAFQDAIAAEIAKHDGRIPVRIKGQRPVQWNGRDLTDSRGLHIRWVRLKDFSFLEPQHISYEYYSPASQ